MILTDEKPENCTCDFPNVINRNITRHANKCPVNIQYWQYIEELGRRETDRIFKLSKKLRYGYSDNVE